MKRNPLEQSEYIRKMFSSYVKSTFVLKNEKYNNDFDIELNNSVLTKGPFLKLELPFEKSHTIRQLIDKNEINKSFDSVSDIKLDQSLYLHQYDALKLIKTGESIVVTTGTGSGKTESFLYPILNKLLDKISNNGSLNGIQAILLYPMNALVNDQLERLRKMLKSVPGITFGYFTGDTPEKYTRKLGTGEYQDCTRQQYINMHFDADDTIPPQNELLTREEIRLSPPNILITNYSMLEYLLVRPKDNAVINQDTLIDWSFMVLDEAHSYRGILATEVSHLLKRLQTFANRTPQFILTSATLGNKDEDKKNIISFAEKLTSAKFTEKGIIYATRIVPSIYPIEHEINCSDYPILLNLIDNNLSLDDMLTEYKSTNLFNLLSRDKNVHILYNMLSKTDTFENIYKKVREYNVNMTREYLIALIALVTYAKNEVGLGIYDVKYHFLVRTLEGAFISLKPEPKLKITNRQKIDDMWAFEIGVCKNCSELYIVGKEYENKLYRSELDIDENYQYFDELKTDFYLIKEDVFNQISDHLDDFDECVVCSKCGYIYQKGQFSHGICDCGNEYQVELLKVKQSDSDVRNNLTECSVCEKTSNKTGMINSFKLGKDQSTALLSQIILKSMDLNLKTRSQIKKLSSVFEIANNEEDITENTKQFLAFSDSRQQASFYALFFQENQNKFLRKALVYKNSTSGPIDVIIPKIERLIFNMNLFDDNSIRKTSPAKNAYISVLLELFKADGINSLEGLGLLSFEPNLADSLDQIDDSQLSEYLPKIKKNQLKDLICIFTDIFRIAPAVDFDSSGLNFEERKEYLEYRRFDKFIVLRVPPKNGDRSIKSLLPVYDGSRNNLTLYMAKTFKLTKQEVHEYIERIWNLLVNLKVIKVSGIDGRGKIDFSSYKIISKDDTKWYVCDKCKTITSHNINDCCVKGECSGKLVLCNPDDLLKDNYYRNEYITKRIESIVVQEHTGQLTREQGRKYQKEFKTKKINVLSSSTTFEMGVNIGSLDTVFMRNIPPTNANYAQRAGRAGRSKESVAFVLTFANHNSHDQIYFNDPIPMIEGKINPPYFKLDNKKITLRHIMAYVISLFYRSTNLESKLRTFIDIGYSNLIQYINSNKEILEKEMKHILNTESIEHFSNYRWFDEMLEDNSLLNLFIKSVRIEIDNLKKAEDKARDEKRYIDASSYANQRKNLLNMGIVEALAKYNVIPGYGFPIDVVPLKVYDRIKKDFNKSLDLGRDLAVALSEYAPDSEIIVDKNKYTSRYIILPKEGMLPMYYYYRCLEKKCGKIQISNIKEDSVKCDVCGSETEELSFMVPNLGFITDEKNKESTILKPRKTYSSEISYLGSMEPYQADLNVNDFLLVQQTSDDKLLIVNENPFFYCSKCGYSVLDKKKKDLDHFSQTHNTFRGNECSNSELEQIKLGHIVITDVIKMRIDIPMDFDIAFSTINAIRNGIISYLQIDTNDINGILVKDTIDRYAFVFYDTTYGGAGNVKQLTEKNGLKSVLEKALISVDSDCCNEEVSCTNCLRNYKNSKYHKNLKRRYARDTIKAILSKFN